MPAVSQSREVWEWNRTAHGRGHIGGIRLARNCSSLRNQAVRGRPDQSPALPRHEPAAHQQRQGCAKGKYACDASHQASWLACPRGRALPPGSLASRHLYAACNDFLNRHQESRRNCGGFNHGLPLTPSFPNSFAPLPAIPSAPSSTGNAYDVTTNPKAVRPRYRRH